MKKLQNIFIKLLAISIFIFASCKSPINRTYRPQTYEEDMLEIQKSNKISNEDLQLIAKYILLAKLSGNDITGKSYDDILDRIKSFQLKNNEVSNRKDLENDARRKRLSPFLEVNLESKVFEKVKYKDVMVYTVKLRNISSKKIKTITGNLTINDLLEKPMKKLDIFVDEDILSGQTLTKKYTPVYNNADENDLRMRSKSLLEMHIVWNPEKIIFENGGMAE